MWPVVLLSLDTSTSKPQGSKKLSTAAGRGGAIDAAVPLSQESAATRSKTRELETFRTDGRYHLRFEAACTLSRRVLGCESYHACSS